MGQCSLTVALPVLSAYGIETCVLPTAILSNHTAFTKWSCLDLTREMDSIMAAWRENHFRFDAFLLGYLGSTDIMKVAKSCFRDFSEEGAKVVIDPAFGDNGKLYPAFDLSYVAAMRDLIRSADIILPNLTEACYLTGMRYCEDASVAFVKEVVLKLADYTQASIVLTGVERIRGTTNEIGELIYSAGVFSEVWAEKLPQRYHGTGDLFAAAFTAVYLQSGDFAKACAAGGELVAESIRATDPTHTYGVNFEYALNKRNQSY